MEKTCVLVADRFRARLFEVESIENTHHRIRLEEHIDLVNRYPQQSQDQHADGSPSKPEFYFLGHDQKVQENDDRKFAKELSQELLSHLKCGKVHQLILVAPPQFLNTLREYKGALRNEVAEIHDYASELSHLSMPEIRDYVEQRIML